MLPLLLLTVMGQHDLHTLSPHDLLCVCAYGVCAQSDRPRCHLCLRLPATCHSMCSRSYLSH
jgi:hypothetical protein